jgi:F0F1-type ATP synthase delta subunit
MEQAYAQALLKSVHAGTSPKEAVSAVAHALKAQGRIELMPRIVRALTRLAEREHNNRPRVYVAREKDGRAAFASSGVKEADVCIDETLIGGWRLEDGETLMDASFKKMLLDMYNRAVA